MHKGYKAGAHIREKGQGEALCAFGFGLLVLGVATDFNPQRTISNRRILHRGFRDSPQGGSSVQGVLLPFPWCLPTFL